VKDERYEMAAKLRDQLRKIELRESQAMQTDATNEGGAA
jgi:protein-arginine kinase activator protein McsA